MIQPIGRQRFINRYMWLIVATGGLVFAYSALRLPSHLLDFRFVLLFLLTVVISSRIAIKVPRVNTTITVADTFVFLTLLLYGPSAAVIVAAADGFTSGLHISKRWITILFNAGASACSIFMTGTVMQLVFGSEFSIKTQPTSSALIALCVVAMAQYGFHTWIVSICLALKHDRPLWSTWTKHYLWSSLTYFIGTFVAGAIVKLETTVSFYAVLAPLPIISVIYFTYEKYLEDIRATAAQAEQAERERAEAEHARANAERLRAEQAERHVEELNRYVEKLEGTSKELQESREHFRYAAFHDALTGLPNRSLFTVHLRIALGRTQQNEEYQFCVLFLDLARFTRGEFAILIDGLQGPAEAIRVAQKIQQTISAPFKLTNHEAVTTASIGIALSASSYKEAEDIIRDADTAMYRAKDQGKARYEIFDTAMHTRAVTLLRLESDLRRALENGELRVHYQPIMSVRSDELYGFEALVRWLHPERGLVPPSEFISLAEETGLIIPLGLTVLRESCGQLHEWQQRSLSNRDLVMSVNLSGRQLTQPDLIERIQEVLRESHINPWHLKLEITESVVMENPELAAATLTKLRGLGVRLSIDDFGTGYSSLSYLNRFPVDTLKIDRSFISRMNQADENLQIVRTIVTLAGNLGMQVIAEGVETEDQLNQLKLLKCQYAQGYLFSKPLDCVGADLFILNRADASVALEADFETVTFAM